MSEGPRMRKNVSPAVALLNKLAAEECWEREYVLWEMMAVVHLGAAARATMKNRRRWAESHGQKTYPQGEHHKHAPEITRPGARQIAQRALYNQIKHGRVVIGADGILRPGPNAPRA